MRPFPSVWCLKGIPPFLWARKGPWNPWRQPKKFLYIPVYLRVVKTVGLARNPKKRLVFPLLISLRWGPGLPLIGEKESWINRRTSRGSKPTWVERNSRSKTMPKTPCPIPLRYNRFPSVIRLSLPRLTPKTWWPVWAVLAPERKPDPLCQLDREASHTTIIAGEESGLVMSPHGDKAWLCWTP